MASYDNDDSVGSSAEGSSVDSCSSDNNNCDDSSAESFDTDDESRSHNTGSDDGSSFSVESFDDHDEKDDDWKVGDRVVLQNLKTASHLNALHGCIGGSFDEETGRFGIDLDLVHPNVNRLMAKPDNLLRESTLFQLRDEENNDEPTEAESDSEENPVNSNTTTTTNTNKKGKTTLNMRLANVQGGILVNEEGRAISLIFDTIRFLVGSILLDDPAIQTGLQDIEHLRRQGPRGQLMINHLMATAWSHWSKNKTGTAYATTTTYHRSVYDLLIHFFEDLPRSNGCDLAEMPFEFQDAKASLTQSTAVQGWLLRIQGDFWIVGCDENDGGTFLVSNVNRNSVYKVFGVRNSLMHMAESVYGLNPVLIQLTSVPWYGRLVYDGVVVPAPTGRPGELPEMADEELAFDLKQSVKFARKEGRVVDKLRQLQLKITATTTATFHPVKQPNQPKLVAQQQHPKAPPTPIEMDLLRKLETLNVSSVEHSCWCLRRKGYTEKDNPEHVGLIINAIGGLPLGPFSCSALVPTAADIFQSLIKTASSTDGKVLPALVLIDDLVCCERVEHLLQGQSGDKSSLKTQYYPPPTPAHGKGMIAPANANA